MIDKKLYRQAYEQYKQWNEIKFAERIRKTAKLSSAERWEQYVDLVEFLWERSPEQTPRQQQQKIAEWEYYYSQMQRFEESRRKHGKTA